MTEGGTRRTRTILVTSVVAVSVVTNAWGISAMGWGNAYYSAAVRSMGSSWHNFLYASFDPGGYVSIDKPPLSMWVQVISAKLFGYSALSLLIPEVIAGALAVWLLYWGLRRTWGTTAGLVGATALALTPIAVAVNHSNNTDSVLALLMTAAAVAAMEAVRTGRFRWLLAACALAGCAMTTKMLAAAPVMPGILIAYAWCAPVRWRVRLGQVAVGALTLASVGLWWFVVVAATPAHDRPYVGSTQTNSVFELAFERNGVDQVDGQSSVGLLRGARSEAERPGPERATEDAAGEGVTAAVSPFLDLAGATERAEEAPDFVRAAGSNLVIPGLGFASGEVGVTRLLNHQLGTQLGWLVPFAAIAAIGALVSTRLRRSPRLGALLVLGCWAGAGAIVFSSTKGVLHPYYLAGIAAPVAGLVGIGTAVFSADLAAGRWRAWFGVAALAATGWAQWRIWRSFDWRRWMSIVVVASIAVAALVTVVAWARVRRRTGPPAHRALIALTASAAAAILLAPAVWTQGSLAAGVSGPLPFAAPVGLRRAATTANHITPNGGFQFPSFNVPSLVHYLRNHNGGERWDLAVESAGSAEELIISAGVSVMSIGGFIGSDPIQTLAQIQQRVKDGQLRYFLVSAEPRGLLPGLFDNLPAIGWVGRQCQVISSDVWEHGVDEDTAKPGTLAFPGGPTAARFSLYDCRDST
ncbi:MAG: glycosyltransferase family 39 protein [Ilumatobacteraceae bacterium]|nr:glycosyltransferase family 39 protein [Ilumatobacteraceae bacterium]